MKLICYRLHHDLPEIRPAPLERAWMDQTPEGFAYRCLPLNIANAHGWEILCGAGFAAFWDGGRGQDAICILPDTGAAPHHLPVSHFGSGVLTFHVNCLFRTEPGINLWVGGPINRPKDGIQGLSGIVETDWAPYTFTMNWLFTGPNLVVRFEQGEPFCSLFPIAAGTIETVRPEIRDLASEPELARAHQEWSESRSAFNRDLRIAGSEARDARWQKTYFRGAMPDGTRAAAPHRTKLRVRPFSQEPPSAAVSGGVTGRRQAAPDDDA